MRGQLCGFVSTWKPQVGCGVSARTVGSLVVVCARGNGKKKGIEDEVGCRFQRVGNSGLQVAVPAACSFAESE